MCVFVKLTTPSNFCSVGLFDGYHPLLVHILGNIVVIKCADCCYYYCCCYYYYYYYYYFPEVNKGKDVNHLIKN